MVSTRVVERIACVIFYCSSFQLKENIPSAVQCDIYSKQGNCWGSLIILMNFVANEFLHCLLNLHYATDTMMWVPEESALLVSCWLAAPDKPESEKILQRYFPAPTRLKMFCGGSKSAKEYLKRNETISTVWHTFKKKWTGWAHRGWDWKREIVVLHCTLCKKCFSSFHILFHFF